MLVVVVVLGTVVRVGAFLAVVVVVVVLGVVVYISKTALRPNLQSPSIFFKKILCCFGCFGSCGSSDSDSGYDACGGIAMENNIANCQKLFGNHKLVSNIFSCIFPAILVVYSIINQ